MRRSTFRSASAADARARAALRRAEHEDARKSGAYSATSRREKRGRAFLRKVGREGIRLYTTRRACTDRSPGGTLVDDAGRLLPRRPCLKARVVKPLSHVMLFPPRLMNRAQNSTFSATPLCRNHRAQLAEASIR